MADKIQPFSEFAQLPLEFVVAGPLLAAVRAQKAAAEATRDYIQSFIKQDGELVSVSFKAQLSEGGETRSFDVRAPLLSIVPVPHLRIDALSVNFRFEVKTTDLKTSETTGAAATELKIGGNPWVNGSLSGSVSTRSATEAVANRSGALEISVQASESEMPEGLAKIASMLANAIQVTPT